MREGNCCQADAWHTAVLQIYIPKGVHQKIDIISYNINPLYYIYKSI